MDPSDMWRVSSSVQAIFGVPLHASIGLSEVGFGNIFIAAYLLAASVRF